MSEDIKRGWTYLSLIIVATKGWMETKKKTSHTHKTVLVPDQVEVSLNIFDNHSRICHSQKWKLQSYVFLLTRRN